MSVVNGEGDAASETNNNNNKDQAIKLFGTTIPLSEPPISPSSYSPQTSDPDLDLTKETSGQTGRPSGLGKNTENQTVSHTNKSNLKTDLKEEEQGENNNNNDTDEEKVFKKPDKIISCPRCNSTETKFCYFNNYNVNQPRHFCKNCQRYWTAGGTMRNVPVGAGRRRNKQLASQYHQIIISSNGVQATRLATTDSSNHQLISCTESTTTTSFKPSSLENGTVLKFGPDTPLCESMENALNLRDRKIGSVYCVDNLDEPSCGSSMTSSTSRENKLPENGISEVNDQTKQNCYPVPPWAIPFSPVWNSVASIGEAAAVGGVPCPVNPNLVPYYPATMFAVPGLGPPGFPLQFVAASSWAGMPVWAAGPGNLTLIGPNGWSSPTPSTGNNCSSGNGSPTLGKHSRDVNVIDEETSEKCVLVPKTLRIDNANEAMKSPNWATLGIKPNQKGMFEGIAEGKSLSLDASHILEANPAALSRSYKLQEST